MSKLKQLFAESTPVVGDVVTWDGNDWVPTAPSGIVDTYSCPAGLTVGTAVYQNGLDSVDAADANDPAKVPCIGFIAAKPAPTTAQIQSHGPLDVFVGLTPIGEYYLDNTPGQIRVNAPASPCVIQKVGFAKNTITLVCMVDRDYVDQTV